MGNGWGAAARRWFLGSIARRVSGTPIPASGGRTRRTLHADPRRFVCIESPYAGDVETNLRYARLCVADSLKRGEYPIASHLLYTQPGILRDDVPEERALGMAAGLAWAAFAALTVVYVDLGTSSGMREGIEHARAAGRPVEWRTLGCPRGYREVGPGEPLTVTPAMTWPR